MILLWYILIPAVAAPLAWLLARPDPLVARWIAVAGTAAPLVRDLCIKKGLMVRAIRDTIVFCPPLIITHAEIDRLVDTIAAALTEMEPHLRALPRAA